MNKLKVILNYLIGFIFSIILVFLVISLVGKNTIYNKKYIKSLFNSNEYYETVYSEIKESMEAYMISSGLSDEILNNIYTKEEVKEDINLYIDNLFNGKKTKLNKDNIRKNLENNIDKYLDNHNVQITNQKLLDSFVKEIVNIYKDEITLFNTADSFISPFYKVGNLLNTVIVILIIISVILILISIIFKFKYFLSSFLASGIIIIFIRFVIYEKIDIRNILIISDYFSKILTTVLEKFGSLLLVSGIILIVVGLIVSIITSYLSKTLEKKKVN